MKVSNPRVVYMGRRHLTRWKSFSMSDSWGGSWLYWAQPQLCWSLAMHFLLQCVEWGSLTGQWHPSARAPCPQRGLALRLQGQGQMVGVLLSWDLRECPLPQNSRCSSCPLALLQALLPSSLLTQLALCLLVAFYIRVLSVWKLCWPK